MSQHKAFAIKHKQTGKFMPTLNRSINKDGATHWNPEEVNSKRRSIRLFDEASNAQVSADRWEAVNGINQLIVVPVTITEDLSGW